MSRASRHRVVQPPPPPEPPKLPPARLGRGVRRRKRSGEPFVYCNLRYHPVVKRRLIKYALHHGLTAGAVSEAALLAAHPEFHPSKPEPEYDE